VEVFFRVVAERAIVAFGDQQVIGWQQNETVRYWRRTVRPLPDEVNTRMRIRRRIENELILNRQDVPIQGVVSAKQTSSYASNLPQPRVLCPEFSQIGIFLKRNSLRLMVLPIRKFRQCFQLSQLPAPQQTAHGIAYRLPSIRSDKKASTTGKPVAAGKVDDAIPQQVGCYPYNLTGP
jgi:hypothetical protein